MNITNIINTMIGDLGFPIVVSLYLLIRLERKIENLSNVIAEQDSNKKG
ncbi:YvrJ family protein [Guptibacillus algicola]|nr:YvrJ family protein [Alkalihalobacillus algicola]MCA0988931.1 YvrJ family protein [Alkalihalobacillus algicola]